MPDINGLDGTLKVDLCVIGAGAGGLSVASGAAQSGARVVLVERGEMGGDCLNTGCVPSKALLSAAAQAQAQRSGGLGVAGQDPDVDFHAVMTHVQSTIATIAPHDSQERFEGLGVQVIRAEGRFLDDRTLEAGAHRIVARRFVIATGARPSVPPIPGLAEVPYLTNENLFEIKSLPDHLLVLGGGVIGLEMAQAFARLGARVTLVEAATLAGSADPDAVEVLRARLRAEGVEIREGTLVQSVSDHGGITLETDAGPVSGSHLLVATGRRPVTEGLNLKAAGVDVTAQGAVACGPDLRSTNRRVYAVGDVAGQGQLTHLAGYHAATVFKPLMLGLPAKASTAHLPAVIYTAPELAQIGPTEAEARAAHADVGVIRQEFAGNDRARAEGDTTGFLKLIHRRGRVIGATLVGPRAGEQAAWLSLVIARRMKLSHLSAMIAPYPTRAEITKAAVGAYFSPKLFDNAVFRTVVRGVQRYLP